jgi:hypothetical protein
MPVHSCSYSAKDNLIPRHYLSPAVNENVFGNAVKDKNIAKPIVTNRNGVGCPLSNMHAHSYFCDNLHKHSAVSVRLAPLEALMAGLVGLAFAIACVPYRPCYVDPAVLNCRDSTRTAGDSS